MKKAIGITVLLVVISVATTFKQPVFLSAENVQNSINWSSLFGILAIGSAFVIISGGIDLSVGSVVCLTGCLLSLLLNGWHIHFALFWWRIDITIHLGVMPSLFVVLTVAALIGLLHGLLITKLRLQSFIVTLCGLLIYRGISRWITGEETQGFGAEEFEPFRAAAVGTVEKISLPGFGNTCLGLEWGILELGWSLAKMLLADVAILLAGVAKNMCLGLEWGLESLGCGFVNVLAGVAQLVGAEQELVDGLEALAPGWAEFKLPIPFVFMAVLGLLAGGFLHWTVYGRYLLALGRNEQAARYSGINTDRMVILAYVLCSLIAGLGGVLLALDINSVQPSSFGVGWEMYAIAAAVLGGCSLRGGEGSVLGVIIGTALIRVILNATSLLGIPDTLAEATTGMVILIGVIADEVMHRIAARRRMRSG